MKQDFRLFLEKSLRESRPIIFDGAMGTMIQDSGFTDYLLPEELNSKKPDLIRGIHEAYLASGANVLTANSFGSNGIKLKDASFSAAEATTAAIENLRSLIDARDRSRFKQEVFAALDMGPTGQLLAPMGRLSFDEAYEAFKESALAAEKAGADLVIIETFSDLYEAKAAILAVKENTSLPIVALMTFQSNFRTLTGSDVETTVCYLESLGVDALGFNCGGSLEEAKTLAKLFLEHANLPLVSLPNAGLPVIEKGQTIFKVGANEFSKVQKEIATMGFSLLGGCCGTKPEHISALVQDLQHFSIPKNNRPSQRRRSSLCSAEKTVYIDNSFGSTGPVIIGERINPTGKKKLKEALLSNDMSYILDEAENQIQAGSHILDVNVGLPGLDEKAKMQEVVAALQKNYATPLQLDSSEPEVLEYAMRYYNGKPLVNSVNGKQKNMDDVFPLVKKYGALVVALCLDEDGIPSTVEGRLSIAKKIYAEAQKYGIRAEDILFDSLTLTLSSQQEEALVTLDAIKAIKKEIPGAKTVLGVSNISFGLPRRDIINAAFFSMALYAGLDACIINPLSEEMMASFNAYRTIAAFDDKALHFIETYSGTQKISSSIANKTATKEDLSVSKETEQKSLFAKDDLQTIIIKGQVDKAESCVEKLLHEGKKSLDIIDGCIVPALDIVGKEYESGKKFLPQLLLSAETVSKAFGLIKAELAKTGIQDEAKGTILIATVEGDIHDIGKNIVKAMLENYGYEVLDLGKDVSAETICDLAVEKNIRLIGLSALMTTTVLNMEKTIKLLREKEKEMAEKFTIMVGGAVLTEDYAKTIGADFYAKDALASVQIAKKFFGK
ncbi:MAG TPA: homocysteine S-methyltransferase family protein [Treponemataceae bacterium]|nr:homocysteine S-methyltransferase family protein [Treponemataceae bacterium]